MLEFSILYFIKGVDLHISIEEFSTHEISLSFVGTTYVHIDKRVPNPN